MVARSTPPETDRQTGGRPSSSPGRLLLGWRRLLTRLFYGSERAGTDSGRRAAPQIARLVLPYLADPGGTLAGAERTKAGDLRVWGLSALAFGAVTRIAVTLALRPVREGVVEAFVDAAWLLGWAWARWAIMRVAAGGAREDRDRVDAAAGPALLPFALAVVFPLDAVALLASWWLTYRGLLGLGSRPETARRATVLAFGGQVIVAVGAWFARGTLIAWMARG